MKQGLIKGPIRRCVLTLLTRRMLRRSLRSHSLNASKIATEKNLAIQAKNFILVFFDSSKVGLIPRAPHPLAKQPPEPQPRVDLVHHVLQSMAPPPRPTSILFEPPRPIFFFCAIPGFTIANGKVYIFFSHISFSFRRRIL